MRIWFSRWIETPAQIQKCSLDEYHPFARQGGGVVFSLRRGMAYAIDLRRYESDLRTISHRSRVMRDRISEWVEANPPGTMLMLRVNPSNPQEIVVESASVVLFGASGLLLIVVGRVLA